MKEIDEIIYELQETWGYTIEEQNHIRDLILIFGDKLLEDDDMQSRLIAAKLNNK